MAKKRSYQTSIPTRNVGPIKIIGDEVTAEVTVPLATFEKPLWPSVSRGAQISRLVGGISATLIDDCMTRSVLLEVPNANIANHIVQNLPKYSSQFTALLNKSSQFTKLHDWHTQIVGNLLFIRFSFTTGDAAGHNMTTKASEILLDWLLKKHPEAKYLSISGNYCTDKKVSAVNGILGRGKYVICEILVPHNICVKYLKTTPQHIVDINIKKNLLGSILAGSIRSANAHFANMLSAFYLATGQDIANIIEGSQGLVHTELRNNDLYFSVTLPNIILGSIGTGQKLNFAKENIKMLGCAAELSPGQNARRLAIIAAATVLCGELSLIATQTNPGELMKSHIAIERVKK
jgi:hydroxymethylglutaryl-CoA reductase (NADPH)